MLTDEQKTRIKEASKSHFDNADAVYMCGSAVDGPRKYDLDVFARYTVEEPSQAKQQAFIEEIGSVFKDVKISLWWMPAHLVEKPLAKADQ